MHDWPPLRSFAAKVPSIARSRSASSKTISGALPPSSIEVRSTVSAGEPQQRAPDLGGAGERHLAHALVAQHGLAERRGVRGGHDLHQVVGNTRAARELDREDRGEGGELGGLDDRRAAGGQRGRDLAGGHREREVPRRDEHRESDGGAAGDDARAAVGCLAEVAGGTHRLLGVPAHEVAAVLDLASRLGEGLAHLAADEVGQVLGVLDEQRVPCVQHVSALARGRASPGATCLVRGGDRLQCPVDVDVFDEGDALARGGVRDLDAVDRQAEARGDARPRARRRLCPRREGVVAGQGAHRCASSATACSIAATWSPSSWLLSSHDMRWLAAIGI